MNDGTHMKIDYKALRKVSPKAARTAVLKYLDTSGGIIADCSRVFGVQRPVVYDIIKKDNEGNLDDRSKAPKTNPRRTASSIEDKVIEVKNKTHLGPKRLSIYLKKYESLNVDERITKHIIIIKNESLP